MHEQSACFSGERNTVAEPSEDSLAVASRRRYTRVSRDASDVAVIAAKGAHVCGSVVEESFGGIGLLFKEHPNLVEGQIIRFVYSGVEASAVIRHVRHDDARSYRVGIEWVAEGLAREIREKCALRSQPTQDKRLEALLQILPGGVSMMWKLHEAEKWNELEAATDRLRREALRCRAERIIQATDAFPAALLQENRKQAAALAIFSLVRECLALVGA